jgi:polyisoprenoid-binding protein YceI
MQCCYLQGQVRTDADGYYQLESLKPGHYAGENRPPPAHIHVELSHPEAQGQMIEIVFAGDPYLNLPAPSGLIVVNLENAVSMEARQPYLHGVADILLPRLQNSTPAPSQEASSGSRTFEIIPQQSEASYQIWEKFAVIPLETSAVAVTRGLEGTLVLDLSNPQPLVSMEVTADLLGLTSDDPNRDEKLFDRWLVTRQFPTARFTGQRIENGPESFSAGQPFSFILLGELTLRDVTRPVSFEATARLDEHTLTGSATTMIKLTDFGIEPPDLLDMVTVMDEVRLTINLTAQEVGMASGE